VSQLKNFLSPAGTERYKEGSSTQEVNRKRHEQGSRLARPPKPADAGEVLSMRAHEYSQRVIARKHIRRHAFRHLPRCTTQLSSYRWFSPHYPVLNFFS